MSEGGPAPGWYDDPEVPSQYRYWDGTDWTEHRSPKSGPPPAPAARRYAESKAGFALGMSIAGIVCCGLLCIPGLIKGLDEMRRADAGIIAPDQRGMALAAAIIGGIGTAFLALAAVFLIIALAAA